MMARIATSTGLVALAGLVVVHQSARSPDDSARRSPKSLCFELVLSK